MTEGGVKGGGGVGSLARAGDPRTDPPFSTTFERKRRNFSIATTSRSDDGCAHQGRSLNSGLWRKRLEPGNRQICADVGRLPLIAFIKKAMTGATSHSVLSLKSTAVAPLTAPSRLRRVPRIFV